MGDRKAFKPSVFPSLNKVLDDVKRGDILSAVSGMLNLDEESAKRFIGSTTITAYRRVHEVAASALDEVIKRLQLLRSPGERQKALDEIALMLSRPLILIEYQAARGQISGGLAWFLKGVMDNIVEVMRKVMPEGVKPEEASRGFQELVDRAKRVRGVLDSLAVLVYKYGR